MIFRSNLLKRDACLWMIAIMAASFISCSQAWVPISSLPTKTPTVSETPTLEPTATQEQGPETVAYAVVWVEDGSTLPVRKPAGISGSAVSELAFNQRGIRLTGSSTRLGSSTWFEIFTPGGETGWVNGWNLTQDIQGSEFCVDTRVTGLFESFQQAISEQNGQLLAKLVNPDRGLTIRHDWWNPDVLILPEDVEGVYADLSEIDWGVLGGSEFSIRGSFLQIIVPQLDDVFMHSPQMSCNAMLTGVTSKDVPWPSEFTNMNYYAFHRPSPEGGNQFDWRTWTLGIEYVDSQPYLSLLIQYRGDI